MAGLATLSKRLEAWVATVGADALVERSTEASDHAFPLRRAQRAAAHQMTEAQEDLAAELSLTGGRAWARLHGEITSRLTVDVPFPGEAEPRTLPMAAVRGLATDPDAGVRRAAFDAELAAWETVEVPLATALNAFKGEANVLNRRRGWEDSLDVALHNNNVDRATLEAMQEAVVASLADFARYNRAKAALLGHPSGALPWWDMLAPVGSGRRFAWTEATDAVAERVRHLLAGSRRPGGPGGRRRLARRRAPRRQGRRRLLHVGPGRGEPGAAQLRRQLRQRADAGPRARPRLPQHQPRAPHAAAAPDAHGAGRDGEHLLRDDHGRRPGWPRPATTTGPGSRSSTATSPAPPRWSPTSTPGSCSSGRCPPSGSGACCRPSGSAS